MTEEKPEYRNRGEREEEEDGEKRPMVELLVQSSVIAIAKDGELLMMF